MSKLQETWDDRHALLKQAWLHYGVTTITATPFDAGVDSADAVILANGVGAMTINLPLASTHKGRAYYIKKIFAAVGAVTLQAQAGDTVDGAASDATIVAQFDSLLVVSDGDTGWWIIASSGPSF